MKFDIKVQTKYLAKPLSLLMLIALVFVTSLFISFSKIRGLNSKIKESQKTLGLLNRKISVLENASFFVRDDSFDYTNLALPSENLPIYAIAHIRKLASENSLVLENLKFSGTSQMAGEIEKTSVSFDVEGDDEVVMIFLKLVDNGFPVSSTNKLLVNNSGTLSRISVVLDFYSSKIPSKISALSDEIKGLTDDEEFLLSKIKSEARRLIFDDSERVNDIVPRSDLFN